MSSAQNPRNMNSHSRQRSARVVCAYLFCILQTLGCDLIVDTEATQCEVDADCTSRGPAFAGTMCTSRKVCGREACTTNRQCSALLGEPGYCRPDQTCARVFTEDCKQVVPANALDHDQLILVGYMGPLQGEGASYSKPTKEGAELALLEIDVSANGLPGFEGGPQRHLGMLLCDDDNDGELGRRPARHLVHDLQVPAIVGPAYSRITVAVTTDVTIPANVLVISPSATSPAITTLADRDLVWRTVPSDAVQAEALRWLLPEVQKKLGLFPETAKVAVVVKQDSYGLGISDRATKPAEPGAIGSPAVKPSAGGFISYEAPTSGQLDAEIARSIAQRVIDVKPDVIFDFGTTEFLTDVLPKIEQSWQKATYLVPEGGRLMELTNFAKLNPTLSSRVLGTAPGARRSAGYTIFEQRFMGRFASPPGNLAEFGYDAVYLMAYSIAISRQARPTGTQLAQAMKQLTPPCTIDKPDNSPLKVPAGFDRFSEYFAAAAKDGCIDFEGASGPLDFNAAGEAESDIATWCVNPNGPDPFPPLDTYYDAAGKQLKGSSVSCP